MEHGSSEFAGKGVLLARVVRTQQPVWTDRDLPAVPEPGFLPHRVAQRLECPEPRVPAKLAERDHHHQPIEQACDMGGFCMLLEHIDAVRAGEGPTPREEVLRVAGRKIKVSLSPLMDEAGGFAGVVMSSSGFI